MQVDIHDLDSAGKDRRAGVLRLTAGRIVAEPPDSKLLRGILAEPVYDPQAGQVLTAEDTPGEWLRALQVQYRSAYLRASVPIEDGEEDDGGSALAQHYAALWNIMQAHGEDVTHEHLHDASAELSGTNWRVTRRRDGEWVAHRFDDARSPRAWGFPLKSFGPAVVKEAQHAPKGGVYLVNMQGVGHFYVGGQWIPAKEIANLPPAERAKLPMMGQETKLRHAAKMGRAARGNVDAGKLQARLQPHARELSGQEHWRADRELHALHNYHGALTLHRIEQLAQQQQGFLKRANLTGAQKKQIAGNLARLHAMVGLAKARGITGQVPKALRQQAILGEPAPTKPAKKQTPPVRPKPDDYRAAAKPKEPAKKPEEMSSAWHTARQRAKERQQGGESHDSKPVESKPAQSSSDMTPEQAAAALAKQAGHVAQPKAGDDDASKLNRQLIDEGKEKPAAKPETPQPAPAEDKPKEIEEAREKPAEQPASVDDKPSDKPKEEEKPAPKEEKPPANSEEERAFKTAFLNVLKDHPAFKDDPAAQKLLTDEATETDKAKVRAKVLRVLLQHGVAVPDRVKGTFAEAYRRAQEKEPEPPPPIEEHDAASKSEEKPAEEEQPVDEQSKEVDSALTSVEGRWDRALGRKPKLRELLASEKLPAKEKLRNRTSVLFQLMKQGVQVPEAVQQEHSEAYEKAKKRLSQGQYQSDLGKGKKNEREEWTDKAFEAGIRPKDLRDAADEVLKEHEKNRTRREKLISRTKELLEKQGVNVKALMKKLNSDGVGGHVKGEDVVTAELSREFPEEFGGIVWERGANEYIKDDDVKNLGVLDYLLDGVPPEMTTDEAYEKAFEYLQEQKEQQGSQPERAPDFTDWDAEDEEESRESSPWEEAEDPWAEPAGSQRKSLRAWLRKSRRPETPGQRHLFDSNQHPRAPKGPHGGEFVAGGDSHPQAYIDAALGRHANHQPTGGGGGLFAGDMEARRGFAKLPDGAPVVFTAGEFKGQTGKIVRDTDALTGTPRIVASVDGREGLVPISPDAIEPLHEHHSWRAEGGGSGAGTEQGGLYTADQFLPKREENPPAPLDNQSPLGDNDSGSGSEPKPEANKMTGRNVQKEKPTVGDKFFAQVGGREQVIEVADPIYWERGLIAVVTPDNIRRLIDPDQLLRPATEADAIKATWDRLRGSGATAQDNTSGGMS